MSQHLSRTAQRMLANIGVDRIEKREVTIRGVRFLLNDRAIACLNFQANEHEERAQAAADDLTKGLSETFGETA
jgi:hypothetical protein